MRKICWYLILNLVCSQPVSAGGLLVSGGYGSSSMSLKGESGQALSGGTSVAEAHASLFLGAAKAGRAVIIGGGVGQGGAVWKGPYGETRRGTLSLFGAHVGYGMRGKNGTAIGKIIYYPSVDISSAGYYQTNDGSSEKSFFSSVLYKGKGMGMEFCYFQNISSFKAWKPMTLSIFGGGGIRQWTVLPSDASASVNGTKIESYVPKTGFFIQDMNVIFGIGIAM